MTKRKKEEPNVSHFLFFLFCLFRFSSPTSLTPFERKASAFFSLSSYPLNPLVTSPPQDETNQAYFPSFTLLSLKPPKKEKKLLFRLLLSGPPPVTLTPLRLWLPKANPNFLFFFFWSHVPSKKTNLFMPSPL